MAPQLRDHDRYDILGEHGRGGLGRVSRAHDRELGRDIAIKELISRGHVSEVRFLREALITARLEHPGIVPVYEAGRWSDGTPFYAMKLVAGRPLRDLLAERKTVDERIGLLHHVIAVADAIAYAHGRNIIHRDLKPANVVVGDFGETVVIDWGLAKDLTAAEESTIGGGPFRVNRDDGLTSAGSVLGTPAYMPPEQERGEAVDQRADVFAIGAMLWELCSLHKLPPSFAGQRRQILRRAGIDQDLITIIEKAVDAHPDRRYPDAAALAADLKAFKAGARIAARRYSLWALLAHWTRRHRAMALSAAAAVALTALGIMLYVRDVTIQRDRADRSEQSARSANTTAEASLDELTLKHAQLLLTTDPSAAVDTLSSYHGTERDRAMQILAEAAGRGTALLRATPHTDNIAWTQGTPSGAILSLSVDGTISVTSADGTSRVLYRGVSQDAQFSYSAKKHLLAFSCDPFSVCIFDTIRNTPLPKAELLRDIPPAGLSFSSDGRMLAVMSKSSVLHVFDVSDATLPRQLLRKHIRGGWDVKFLDDNVIAAGTPDGIEFIDKKGDSEIFSVPNSSVWDASPDYHQFALATTDGDLYILSSFPLKVAARHRLCHSPVVDVKFIPAQRSVGYACQEGGLGIWEISQDTIHVRAQLEGHADSIAVSSSGEYLFAADSNGVLMVIDLQTDLVSMYRGHAFRLTFIAPPTGDFPSVISADARGSLRTWMLPNRLARLVTLSQFKLLRAVFRPRSSTIIATTWLPELTTYSSSSGTGSIPSHESDNIFLQRAPRGQFFVTYGVGDLVEIWDFATLTRRAVIRTNQISISALEFMRDSADFVTSGRDGRIVRWTIAGQETTLARVDQPTDKVAFFTTLDVIAFSTSDGNLWLTDVAGRVHLLRESTSRINCLISDVADRLYIGYANGDFVIIDPKSGLQKTVIHSSHAIRDVVVNDKDGIIAIGTNDDEVYIGTLREASILPQITWINMPARISRLAFSPDGLLIAASATGAIWIYAPSNRRWLYVYAGARNLGWTVVNDDGTAAGALDTEGHVVWIDLKAVQMQLN